MADRNKNRATQAEREAAAERQGEAQGRRAAAPRKEGANRAIASQPQGSEAEPTYVAGALGNTADFPGKQASHPRGVVAPAEAGVSPTSAMGQEDPVPAREEGSGVRRADRFPVSGVRNPDPRDPLSMGDQQTALPSVALPNQRLVSPEAHDGVPLGTVANRPYGSEPRGIDPATGSGVEATPGSYEGEADRPPAERVDNGQEDPAA
jgi:hypothetical protein